MNAVPAPSADVRAGIGWRDPHHEALLTRRPGLGFVEVHSENFFAAGGAARAVLRAGREAYDVSLHGVGLALGSAHGLDGHHLEQLARLVDDIEPVRVSDHAAFARGAAPGGGVWHASDLLPSPFTRESLDVMARHVQAVQERLRRPIAVENLSAYLRWRDHDMDEATFLNELARRTGCGLLVDINNLWVNALNDQRQGRLDDPDHAVRAWLDAIEPHAVAEIHLAGHTDTGDWVIDDHGSAVAAPVWALYRHAIGRCGPVPTLIEWDTDLPPLDTLLDEAARADAAMHSADGVPA